MPKIVVPKGKSIKDVSEFMQEAFKKDFLNPALSIRDIAEKWGRQPSTIYNWGNLDLGLSRPRGKGNSANGNNRSAYRELLNSVSRMACDIPEVKIPYLKAKPVTTLPNASVIAKISDMHFGRKTQSFDSSVGAHRLGILGKDIDALADMLAGFYNVQSLEIFAEGDWLLGERLGYQVNVEEVERFIMEQVFECTVPYMSQWMLDRLYYYPFINFHGVPGNHGELGRFQSQSANWDTFTYKVIEQRLYNQSQIKFNIAVNDWKTFAHVQDATFLVVHGDQFPVSKGYPQKAAADMILRWLSTMPTPFDHVSFSHFHSTMKFLAGSIPCYCNGTILSDDEWVRETLALEGSCSQTALVVSGGDVVLEKEIILNG